MKNVTTTIYEIKDFVKAENDQDNLKKIENEYEKHYKMIENSSASNLIQDISILTNYEYSDEGMAVSSVVTFNDEDWEKGVYGCGNPILDELRKNIDSFIGNNKNFILSEEIGFNIQTMRSIVEKNFIVENLPKNTKLNREINKI